MNITQYEDMASEPGIERLYFEIPIGAVGAPGTPVRQRGLRSTTPVVRNSAGNFSFFLTDGTVEIVDARCDIQTTAGGAVTAGAAVVCRQIGRTPGGATPNVQFLCTSGLATPVATDPANGDTLIGYIAIKNTNA
jgi:hypothetical protein